LRLARVLLLTAFLSVFASATSIRPMTVEELTQAASRVVEVQVLESHSEWNADHSKIYTISRVRVSNVLKGGNVREVTIRQPGGSADGYTMKVSGVRALQIGEQTMMFLRPSPQDDGTWSVVGLMQGNFHIYYAAGRKFASNGITSRETRLNGGITSRSTSSSLEEIETRVQEAQTK